MQVSKNIAQIFFQLSGFLRKAGNRISPKDKAWFDLLKKWQTEDVDKQFRTTYPALNADSLVFDLGGYQGQWASDIFSRYLCKVHIFEPHPVFAAKIKERFSGNFHINVYDFGLGPKEYTAFLSTQAEASSLFGSRNNAISVKIKCIRDFLPPSCIDLIKINIEGAEYELLEYLIDENLISQFKNIQVQFHHFVPDASARMQRIQKHLSRTHYLTYQFPFLWENWQIIER